jgi:hypothetical protein
MVRLGGFRRGWGHFLIMAPKARGSPPNQARAENHDVSETNAVFLLRLGNQ